FTHRREALSSRKQEWNENLARKEALCERAQQLADSTDWDTTASELKKLQAEWKAIGPTRRDKSEEVWTRFRSAADKFFERYANRHKIAAAAQLAECEALVVALENLGASEDAPSEFAAARGGCRDGSARTMDGRACCTGLAVAGRVSRYGSRPCCEP